MSPVVLPRPATAEDLFVWIMHRFAEAFEEHAILKGGMALRLLDSPRSTTDVDYVFAPFASKKHLAARLRELLDELEEATVRIDVHSTMVRAEICIDEAAVQIEASVARRCDSVPMATGGFAREHGQPSRIVRIMSPAVALAHKLAAWNERRLHRDLFDCYFLAGRLREKPDRETLTARLSAVRSRLPTMRTVRSVSSAELTAALREALDALTDEALTEELAATLPAEELAGLALRIRASLAAVCEQLEAQATE
jgi:predicted nucleotidyltransferase component of viral defense system